MDNRGVKRPRSGALDESSHKTKKDKSKKKKKSKPNLKKPEGKDDTANSLESTATADGQHMAKLLSTFSKIEMSRFEAFKRVSFPCNAISQYVAHCLAQRQQQPQRQHLDGTKTLAFQRDDEPPRLEDLVVPGQDEEITTVVATLAKAYAQRLCAAAKVAQQQQQQQQSTDADGTTTTASAVTSSSGADSGKGAIKPEHVLQAFHARQKQGLDPGFFLQANECITQIDNTAKEQTKRVAALAAQEDFDRCFEEYKELYAKRQAAKKENDNGTPDEASTAKASSSTPAVAEGGETKPMDEDSDSGDEEEIELDMEKEMEKEMTG